MFCNEEIFNRFTMMLNEEQIKNLFSRSIIVFGVGGVGGAVAHMLARSGIQKLAIVDFDKINDLFRGMINTKTRDVLGETIIKDAAELKVKESDRIKTVVENLSAMGCDITATDDGMIIRGQNNRLGSSALYGTEIKTYLDHRIAMAFAIAGLVAESETSLDHPECVSISYPTFFETLKSLQ